jgi:hypothetical protein
MSSSNPESSQPLPDNWEQLLNQSTPVVSQPSGDQTQAPPAEKPKKKLMKLNPHANSFVPTSIPAPSFTPPPPVSYPFEADNFGQGNFAPGHPSFDMFGPYGHMYNNGNFPPFQNMPPNMGFPGVYNQNEMIFDEQSGFA